MSPRVRVSEAINYPSAQPAGLICSVPAPRWAPQSYPHGFTLFLPGLWIPGVLLTSSAALQEKTEPARVWGCMPETIDQRVLESTVRRESVLFSAPTHAERCLNPVALLQHPCTIFPTSHVLGGVNISLAFFTPYNGEFICKFFWSFPCWQMEEWIFPRVVPVWLSDPTVISAPKPINWERTGLC